MDAVQSQPAPADRRWLVLASAVLSFFAVGATFFAVPPLVPELISRFALSHLEIGALMGAIAVPAIFLSIPLGLAVDRWPARAAGNLGLGLMVAGSALFAVAPSYGLLVAGRLLFGIGGLVMNLLLARLISSAFAGRELALAMGIFMAVYPASMIVVFSSHTALLARLGWRLELAALALLAVAAVPLHNLAVPRSPRGTSAPGPAGAGRSVGRPLAVLGLSWMLFFFAFASVATFAPEWAGGDERALLTVTVIMWVSLVCSPLAGAALDRFGRPTLWIAGGQATLAAVLVAMAYDVFPPLFAMVVIGLCAAVVPTATYALPSRLVPASRVGFAFGFITALSNLGTVLGPAVAGAFHDATSAWSFPWLALAGAALAGGAAVLWSGPPPEIRSEPAGAQGPPGDP